jgi:phosphoribosyl 1,2-cyclic phosphodiesterase
MRFASLGSGSQGNATVVSCDGDSLLVDCGFSLREVQTRLDRLGLCPSDLSAILVTHEHSDHIRGVGPLARKYGIPVVMTRGTAQSGRMGRLPSERIIEPSSKFDLAGFEIHAVAVAHDAAQPSQFVFCRQGIKLGLLTDLGSISVNVLEAYQGCDGLLVEANHDPIMLACGPYPPSLKRRVAGQWGHLSNEQTQSLLMQLDVSRLQHLVVGHISQTNNSICRASGALEGLVPHIPIHFACQNQGFDWLTLQ